MVHILNEQLIDLENVSTENLKFRTDLQDGWLVRNTVDNCLQRLKNLQIEN